MYRHALFAQGVRSMIERESGVQIVGMENDLTRAAVAVRTLQPEVILVEETMDLGEAWAFLEATAACRFVTVSLSHAHATVYDRRRTGAASPSDLVEAILGTRVDPPPVPVGHAKH